VGLFLNLLGKCSWVREESCYQEMAEGRKHGTFVDEDIYFVSGRVEVE
jgi:hypothetical protein